MRALIQRVNYAKVHINGSTKDEIGKGLLVFLGIGDEDSEEDLAWLVRKVCSLRIFEDEEGKMNNDLAKVDGSIMVISQFTLHAKYQKGTRPSFVHAAKPELAIPLYKKALEKFEGTTGKKVASGEFGADMKVDLENDGPVTIWIDTKNKE